MNLIKCLKRKRTKKRGGCNEAWDDSGMYKNVSKGSIRLRRNLSQLQSAKYLSLTLLPPAERLLWGPEQVWGQEGSSVPTWSNSCLQEYPSTGLLLHCHFKPLSKNKTQLCYSKKIKIKKKKPTLLAANLQASASEKQQTSLIWVCLGDKAQDMLKSAPWECKSEQLCQAWGASTALPEQARAQQFLKQQPMSSCYRTYPAPALQPLGSSTAACRVLWWREEGDERAPRLTSRFCGFV